jgi:two-component system, OmpR family, catabolic regulation response regulator CreB
MQTPSEAKDSDPSLDGPIVLLIEDDPAIAETIGFALRQGGFKFHWCAQGILGLEQFQTMSPHLVILDVGLPDIGGFEVCRRIRQLSQKPVLFLTAHSEEIDRIQGFELGADDYIAKPFSPRELVSRVRAILRRAGSTMSDTNNANASLASSETASSIERGARSDAGGGNYPSPMVNESTTVIRHVL